MKSTNLPKIDAVIQARVNSSRLPAKVLTPIAGRALLLRVVDRLRACPLVDRIIIATTTNATDDQIANLCEREGLPYFRGDEESVLHRFLDATKHFGCERILRVCGDNPFIDSALITAQINAFTEGVDYVTYVTDENDPLILKPIGVFVEGVSRSALDVVAREANAPIYLEHVTMYIYKHPERFHIVNLPLPEYVVPDHRLTVDYIEDVHACEYILSKIENPNTQSIMQLIKEDTNFARSMKEFSNNNQKVYVIPSKPIDINVPQSL